MAPRQESTAKSTSTTKNTSSLSDAIEINVNEFTHMQNELAHFKAKEKHKTASASEKHKKQAKVTDVFTKVIKQFVKKSIEIDTNS